MSSVRPQRGQSSGDTVAVHRPSANTLDWLRGALALTGVLALAGMGSPAGALTLTGGASYTLPAGGGCSVSGVASQNGGATITCSGVNLSAYTKVYFGLRNDLNVNGNTMTGSAPAAASPAVYRFASNTANSITYTSSTTIPDILNGTQNVDNRLILTLLTGSATVVAAGGNPANNNNGDIQAVFQITSTSFQIRADVQSRSTFFPVFGNAAPIVYDPTHTPAAGGGLISKVDVAFYRSECGDGQFDAPEQCDLGGQNGSSTSCCTTSCTFRTAGQICRPAAAPPCDNAETCTGASGSCPPDDAPLNAGVVCRSGSGDVCDANETCTGVPGQGCPADDAPSNTGVICRVASVGDMCDEHETCTGLPGAPCPPDDAPGKINLVCRAGSGDICDPEERCTGNPGQGCPANVVAPPSTQCRAGAGDMCDPPEFCTAVPGQPCPANSVAPATTVCRAAAGACDVAETCTGNIGQLCPPNAFAPANTSCNADADVCTVDKCNGSGTCVFSSNLDCEDGNTCTQDFCDPQTGCYSLGQPSNSCVSPSKAILKIKDAADDTKDSVKFMWRGGPALVQDMGNPTQSTRYELCIYDASGVRMAMGVPGGANWSTVGAQSSPKGYKYKDLSASSDGIKLIKIKGSSLDKAKSVVVGKGGQLPDTANLPFTQPVIAQLYASGGMCWEAQFGAGQTKKNTATAFTGGAP